MAMQAMKSAISPPSAICGSAWRFTNDGSRTCTRAGFADPSATTKQPSSPRGELGCFVVADGSAKPARVHMRDPSFVNLQSLRHMSEGRLIADLIAGIAMLDPILGGIDR